MLPNTNERDLQANIQNYNNLLEQQIFEEEDGLNENGVSDEARNLSLAGVNLMSKGGSAFGFQMKENRGDTVNQT